MYCDVERKRAGVGLLPSVAWPAVSQDWNDLVGTELAGFRLERLIGEGGQAAVFEGRNLLRPDVRRALKVVSPLLARDRAFRERFLEEARTLERLVHKNIVGFRDVRLAAATRDGQPLRGGELLLALELELLEGRNLHEIADANTRPDVVAALEWFAQVCDGLEAAHAQGVVHRDIKPGNLFLTNDGTAKVIDFGIAQAIHRADAASGGRLTRTGQTAGTSLFIAPELWRGQPASPQSDLYSLGLAMAQVLLGRHPFAAAPTQTPSHETAMMGHLMDDLREHLVAHGSGLEPPVIAMLLRLCARDPRERPATAAMAADELRSLRDQISLMAKESAAITHPVRLSDLSARFRASRSVASVRDQGSMASSPGAHCTTPDTTRRAVWVVAALVVLAAIVSVAASMMPQTQPVAASATTPNSQGTASSGTDAALTVLAGEPADAGPPPRSAPTPAELQEAQAALDSCHDGLDTGNLDAALAGAERALQLAPGIEGAEECKLYAARLLADLEVFARGRAQLEADEIDAAYFTMELLSAESELRLAPEFAAARLAFARLHITLARDFLASNPEEAANQAQMVVETPDVPRAELAEAQRMLTAAQRAMTAAAAAPPRGAGAVTAARHGTTAAEAAPPLEAGAVQPVVTNNRRSLQLCYERAASGEANPPRTRMDVSVTISRSGTVTAVSAAGSDFGGLGACIERAVRRWRFPVSSEGGSTRFPVVFSVGG